MISDSIEVCRLLSIVTSPKVPSKQGQLLYASKVENVLRIPASSKHRSQAFEQTVVPFILKKKLPKSSWAPLRPFSCCPIRLLCFKPDFLLNHGLFISALFTPTHTISSIGSCQNHQGPKDLKGKYSFPTLPELSLVFGVFYEPVVDKHAFSLHSMKLKFPDLVITFSYFSFFFGDFSFSS